jgi:hypothetical protein
VATGWIEVLDGTVRVEIELPWLMQFLRDTITKRVRGRGRDAAGKAARRAVGNSSVEDILLDRAASIIAIAVGLGPGIAVLSARSIVRLIHRVPWPRSEVAPRSGPEPSHGEPLGIPAPRA